MVKFPIMERVKTSTFCFVNLFYNYKREKYLFIYLFLNIIEEIDRDVPIIYFFFFFFFFT